MRLWELGVIEEALGDDSQSVLLEAIRLVELRARVPRYQRAEELVGCRGSRWRCSGRRVSEPAFCLD
jgi:hypothetical protein